MEQDHPLPLHATFELLTYHEDRIITLDLSLIYKMNGLAQTEFKWIGSSVTAIKSTEFNRVSLFNPNILDLLADFFCTSRNLEAKLSFVKHFNLTA
ncbi:MAG: hypothetical protein KA028_02800 [Candidatus Pacebacteria bacterium]|nr:hypothetical protein [Candidatus Paceibacterota bacterium]